MSTVSKSPRKLVAVALYVGQPTFPPYSHRCLSRLLTQPQLLACFVLKSFFKTDLRGIVAYLHDMPALQEQLGLKRVPHYPTLQKASARLLNDEGDRKAKRLITYTLYAYPGDDPEPDKPDPAYVFDIAAVDSTGFDAGPGSRLAHRPLHPRLVTNT